MKTKKITFHLLYVFSIISDENKKVRKVNEKVGELLD